jgi:hypothetical protein
MPLSHVLHTGFGTEHSLPVHNSKTTRNPVASADVGVTLTLLSTHFKATSVMDLIHLVLSSCIVLSSCSCFI